MKSIEVGAFEAKTNLSSLLREVERGVTVHITRRGKPVAVLKKEEGPRREDPAAALGRLRENRKTFSVDELIGLRDAGRER
jgi:antitoxin (DNA-binding transcriptional repressor) of toxin-antitoxin stability system